MVDIAKWFMSWTPRRPSTSGLPFGIEQHEIDAIDALRSSPHWPHYLAMLERLGEQQASTLASGVDHDKYLFASGALTALRRVYTLADDLIAAANNLKEQQHARDRKLDAADRRHADTFVNTPWYDSWRADSVGRPRR